MNAKIALLAQWNTEWTEHSITSSDAARILLSLFPNPLIDPIVDILLGLPKREAQILIKLWTSDFFLGSSRHRLANVVLPTCLCDHSLDSLHHFLFQCIDFHQFRLIRDAKINPPAITVQQLLLRKDCFSAVTEFMWSCCILHMAGQRPSHLSFATSNDPRIRATRVTYIP
jgi:hypothetical protein